MVRVLVCAVLVAPSAGMVGAVVPRWYRYRYRARLRQVQRRALARGAVVYNGHVLMVPFPLGWSGRALCSPPAGRPVFRDDAMATWWMHSSELGVHERPVPARASSLTRTAVMEGILLKRRELVVVAADFVEDEGDAV
jgi:hypothetical protein